MGKITDRQTLKEGAILVLGGVLFAFSLNVFLMPKGIILGGASGVATMLNILFSLPTGLVMFILNLPLIIANAIVFGVRFISRTLLGVALTSVLTDVFSFLPHSNSEDLVCALLGGVCMGAGVGIMFYYGVTTGGTDLAACLLRRKFKNISTSRLILVTDAVIILVCAVILNNYDGILYSLIASISAAFALDASESGLIRSKLLIVISDNAQQISSELSQQVNRGITVVNCKGWYTGRERQMLFCVVKRNELFQAKKAVIEKDPDAFVIMSDASAVHGKGFFGREI